jgi:beta-mannosidase
MQRAIIIIFSGLLSLFVSAQPDDSRNIFLSKGGWKLTGKDPQKGVIREPGLTSGEWLSAEVPGDVNAILLKHGKIPDPHYDVQARQAYWVTSKEWWYALDFDASGDLKNPALVFEGIDGTADVFLNGTKLGTAKNAFYPHRYNVAGILKPSGNNLRIRFYSINELLGGERLDELKGWGPRRAFLRKPQYNFGWDWSLPLPSLGLVGDVYIIKDDTYKLIDHSVRTFTSGRVDFTFEVSKAAMKTGYSIRLKVEGHGTNISRTVSRDAHKSYVSFNIPEPKLWYPNGYGRPDLYNYSIELVVNNNVVDSKKGRFGIREVEIKENPFTPEAGPGFSFQVAVNGEPVFCKGSNWIPCEIWPGTVKPEQIGFYLRKAKDANFNMLRVWGGGIYEQGKFYELCDELGIMVWQDFMMASTGYPADTLRDELIKEANYQIKRLRNHPSVALWCGMNEDVYSWSYPGSYDVNAQADNETQRERKDQWSVNRLKDDPIILTMILRGLVSKQGLGVPYVESSPQASFDDVGNWPNSGNSHISSWKTALFDPGKHPETWRKHFEDVCSFNSEFCIQGPANVKTIRKFMAPQNQWPPNDAWIYHIQRGHQDIPHYEQTMYIAGATFGEIKSLQEYVKHGQATHVEQTRAEYESARRDRPNNGGTMSWMFNDCWPTSNWSIIDYYRQEKPSYYAAKRACATLLPIIFERKGKIEFLFGNDTLASRKIKAVYGQEKLSGEKVWIRSGDFIVARNSTLKFAAFPKDSLKTRADDFYFIEAEVNGKKLPKVTYFPDGWKNIPWPSKPKIRTEIVNQRLEEGRWISEVRVTSDKFVRLCHVLLKAKYESRELPVREDLRCDYSDNYFDLSAGDEHTIIIGSQSKISAKDLYTGHWLTEWE